MLQTSLADTYSIFAKASLGPGTCRSWSYLSAAIQNNIPLRIAEGRWRVALKQDRLGRRDSVASEGRETPVISVTHAN
jgi:hypothetical protein